MTKKDLILAALASSPGATYTPVQVQKLLFLIDRNVPTDIDGPVFNFTPYDYGPFDSSVYTTIERLEESGLAHIEAPAASRWRNYRLTAAGQLAGEALLLALPERIATYIRDLSRFVRAVSFAELVSAIYEAYPEMRARSVFRG